VEEIEVLEIDKKPKKRKRKLKRGVRVLLWLLLIMVILVVGALALFSFLLSPVSSRSEVIEFTVKEGSSAYLVGEKLEKEGIIRSNFAYKVYVKLKNVNGYKAGVYRLDKSFSTPNIVDLLTGDYYKKNGVTITFKEGKTITNVAKTIASSSNVTESEFYALMEDKEYVDQLINKYWFLTDDIKNSDIYYPLEGYLFPETYTFSTNLTAKTIIETMLDQTDKVLSKYKSLVDAGSYTIHQLVTMASMVEKEGITAADRKGIAGVFYNRLNAGMSLGSDVTTYYAFKVDMGERDLTVSEINTFNPYNTRGPQMAGKLPVGPIANFGESSFDAVINPTKSSYYYFVADKSGKTHFTKTYEEHQQVIKELKEAGNWITW